MSDYLTRLVTRNLDMTPVVRPRPKPLFAPELAVVQPEFEPVPLLETPTVEAPPRSVHDNPPAAQEPIDMVWPRADQPRLLADAVSATPRPRSASPSPPLSTEVAAEAAPPSEAVAPRRQPAHVLPRPLSPPAAQPRPVADNGSRSDAMSFRPAPVPSPQHTAAEPVVVPEPSYSADASPPAPPSLVVAQPQVVPAASVQPASPSRAPLMIAEPSARSESSTIQPTRRSTPPIVASQPATTEPTIHVTIGRIEVRAAPPAPVARPRSATAPTMSLDDYLRERSGGRR